MLYVLQWLSDRRKRTLQKNDIGDLLVLLFSMK